VPLQSLTNQDFHPASAVGVLKGTFLSLIGGCVWFDLENHRLLTQIPCFDFAFGSYAGTFTEEIIANLPRYAATVTHRYTNLPVLASPYANNYFHVTLECAAALRLLGDRHRAVAVPPSLREFTYQHELIGRCLRGREAVPVEDPAIFVDPVLFYDYFSMESIDYVRRCMNVFARPGGDVVYLERRNSNRIRPGGIAETPEFRDVLARHRARRVDVGGGELTVAEQVARLDGARTILAPHGAALTNMIYLNPPLTLVEVFPSYLASHDCYAEIARLLGFTYRRIVAEREDEHGNLIPDPLQLDAVLREAT